MREIHSGMNWFHLRCSFLRALLFILEVAVSYCSVRIILHIYAVSVLASYYILKVYMDGKREDMQRLGTKMTLVAAST